MTIKLFWENPYLTEHTTTVTDVKGNQIKVSETIFFAFSGGQESDIGTIGPYTVLSAKKEGKALWYTLPDDHSLKVNYSVQMTIDWGRRYKLMRLHFAAEIVLELINQKFQNMPKTGAHISEHKARIDFKWDQSLSSNLMEIQNAAQGIIDANHPVQTGFTDVEHERRYWKIDGFSSVPCGGTHIKNTQEVGILRLKRVNPGKGIERIEIYVE